ncbi:MAG: hypothetical protein QNJ55_27155 [Xenococcus sp. MO_188.B8]|nr:hypothetical protein [Xenococcus sp. MO_188.B8]
MPDPPEHQERRTRQPAGGTGAEGRATSKPREPAATERIQREDRRAKAARPTPNRPEATENTSREGEPLKKPRTTASTPRAQPTETLTPEGTRGNRAAKAAAAAGNGEREPEKPTEETPAKTETGEATDIKKTYATPVL